MFYPGPDTYYDFYGVDSNRFKLNNKVYEAIKDPEDGYRSHLRSIDITEDPLITFMNSAEDIFFDTPLASVRVQELTEPNFKGYGLIDTNEHMWVKIGTDTYDNWYPCFVFRYMPPT